MIVFWITGMSVEIVCTSVLDWNAESNSLLNLSSLLWLWISSTLRPLQRRLNFTRVPANSGRDSFQWCRSLLRASGVRASGLVTTPRIERLVSCGAFRFGERQRKSQTLEEQCPEQVRWHGLLWRHRSVRVQSLNSGQIVSEGGLNGQTRWTSSWNESRGQKMPKPTVVDSAEPQIHNLSQAPNALLGRHEQPRVWGFKKPCAVWKKIVPFRDLVSQSGWVVASWSLATPAKRHCFQWAMSAPSKVWCPADSFLPICSKSKVWAACFLTLFSGNWCHLHCKMHWRSTQFRPPL